MVGPSKQLHAYTLRNTSLISQERLQRERALIVGCGAVGSHLAPMLAKMGLSKIELWDGDVVSPENIGPQGFKPEDLGELKVIAVGKNCSLPEVTCNPRNWKPGELVRSLPTLVFNCADSMLARHQLLAYCTDRGLPLFDSRMAAERLEIWTALPSASSQRAYEQGLFSDEEADPEPCTAKATIYCATLCAALLCAQAKRWMFLPQPELKLAMDLRLMTWSTTPQPEEDEDV